GLEGDRCLGGRGDDDDGAGGERDERAADREQPTGFGTSAHDRSSLWGCRMTPGAAFDRPYAAGCRMWTDERGGRQLGTPTSGCRLLRFYRHDARRCVPRHPGPVQEVKSRFDTKKKVD